MSNEPRSAHDFERLGVSDFQAHRVLPAMQTERPLDDFDVVAEINIRLRRNGAMSVEGAIGDLGFALAMLGNAREAIVRQRDPAHGLLVPGHDISVPDSGPRIA